MADGDAAVQKRLKALRKKLAQIEKLEGKGGSLSPEEAEKVSAKADIEAEITVLEAKGDEPEPTSAPAPTPAPKATPVVAAVPEVAAEPVKQPAPEEVISITEAPPVEEAPAEVVSEQLQVGGPEALKRIKNLKKKLAQINKLKEKGGDLSVEEAEKVASEESILSEIAVLEGKEAPKVNKKAAPEKQVFAPSERVTKPAAPASDTAEPKATAETQKEDAAPVPEEKGPTGLERCAELIPRLLLEPEAEKKAKALQKKLRDIEKLKEKRTTEGKLEKLQEEKVAGEERLLKELGELEVAYPPRQNKRQGRKTYDEEGEDEAELAKSKPAEEEDDDDEDEAKEKRSKNPGKDSVSLKTKRQQAPAASTKSKAEFVLVDAKAATWAEVKDVAASGSGGVDRGRQKHALIVNQSKSGAPYDNWDAYIWKLSFITRLELNLPPATLAGDDFQRGFPGGLVDLVELILKGNALPTLPPALGRLHRLRYLDVSFNALEELPGEETWEKFAGCLETLDLSFNSLSSVEQLSPLTKLSSLKLDKNKLTSLSGISWGSLKQLTSVSAVGNQIKAIPDEIGESGETLEWVDFSENAIVAVPEAFCDLKKLKSFQMGGNPIKDQKVVKYLEKEGKGLKELKVYLQKPKPGKKK